MINFEIMLDAMVVIFFVLIASLILVVGITISEKNKRDKKTYTECIATERDKFECYSIVYGGGLA